MKILVTGITGFIGSYFAKFVLQNYPEINIIGLTTGTNQKHFDRIQDIVLDPRLTLISRDLSQDNISDLFNGVEYVFHFAAHTHVDYSITDPEPFIQSNIVGTFRVLEAERKHLKTLKKCFHISTDEVYGPILKGKWTENSPLNPSNPYSSSKACADMLNRGWFNTYKVPVITTRTENNYGIFQGPEKAIPTFTKKALNNEPLPVYGDGHHRRMWLHVEDHVRALLFLMEHGEPGEIYLIAGEQELENIELAKLILKTLDKPQDRIQLVPDFDIRPGHDRRYALDVSKLKSLGWKPLYNIETGIPQVVRWYQNNSWWFNQ